MRTPPNQPNLDFVVPQGLEGSVPGPSGRRAEPTTPSDPRAPHPTVEDAAASRRMRERDRENIARHHSHVRELARQITSETSGPAAILANAAAHDVQLNQELGTLEVLLAGRLTLLVQADCAALALKVARVLRDVAGMRRAGTRRVEESLNAICTMEAQARIACRPSHVRVGGLA